MNDGSIESVSQNMSSADDIAKEIIIRQNWDKDTRQNRCGFMCMAMFFAIWPLWMIFGMSRTESVLYYILAVIMWAGAIMIGIHYTLMSRGYYQVDGTTIELPPAQNGRREIGLDYTLILPSDINDARVYDYAVPRNKKVIAEMFIYVTLGVVIYLLIAVLGVEEKKLAIAFPYWLVISTSLFLLFTFNPKARRILSRPVLSLLVYGLKSQYKKMQEHHVFKKGYDFWLPAGSEARTIDAFKAGFQSMGQVAWEKIGNVLLLKALIISFLCSIAFETGILLFSSLLTTQVIGQILILSIWKMISGGAIVFFIQMAVMRAISALQLHIMIIRVPRVPASIMRDFFVVRSELDGKREVWSDYHIPLVACYLDTVFLFSISHTGSILIDLSKVVTADVMQDKAAVALVINGNFRFVNGDVHSGRIVLRHEENMKAKAEDPKKIQKSLARVRKLKEALLSMTQAPA